MHAETIVILGSSETALAVARSARRNGLDPVVVATCRGVATESDLCAAEVVPGAADEQLLESVLKLAGRSGRCALIATSDDWLKFIVKFREQLDGTFATVLHPGNAAISICLDKESFAVWSRDHRLPCPVSYDIAPDAMEEDLAGFAYPLIMRAVKSDAGGHAAGIPKVVQVHNGGELVRWKERFETAGLRFIVTQSLLNHDLVQLSVPFARDGKKLTAYVAEKVRPFASECAVGTYVKLVPDPTALDIATRAVELLDYYGIGEVELLYSRTSGAYYLIEINARPWSQYHLAVLSGHDFLTFLLNPSAYDPSREVKEGKSWINHLEDFYVCWSKRGYLRNRSLGLSDYLRSVATASDAIFDLRDSRPFRFRLKQVVSGLVHRGSAAVSPGKE